MHVKSTESHSGAKLYLDDFTVYEDVPITENIADITFPTESSFLNPVEEGLDGTQGETDFATAPMESGANGPIAGLGTLKLSVSKNNEEWVSYMNLTPSEVPVKYEAGKSYRFTMKLSGDNLKFLCFRIHCAGTASSAATFLKLDYPAGTPNGETTDNISGITWTDRKTYYELEFVVKADTVPDSDASQLYFELHRNDTSTPAIIAIDDFAISEVTAEGQDKLLFSENFNYFNNLRDDTAFWNFDEATVTKIVTALDKPLNGCGSLKFTLQNDQDDHFQYAGMDGNNLLVADGSKKLSEAFEEGKTYRFTVKYAAQNVKFVLFRNRVMRPVPDTEGGFDVGTVVKYDYPTGTRNGETTDSVTNFSVKRGEEYQEVEFYITPKKIDRTHDTTPLFFELHRADVTLPGYVVIDDLRIEEVESDSAKEGKLLYFENFETMPAPDSWTWSGGIYPSPIFLFNGAKSSEERLSLPLDGTPINGSGSVKIRSAAVGMDGAHSGQVMELSGGALADDGTPLWQKFAEGKDYRFTLKLRADNVQYFLFRTYLVRAEGHDQWGSVVKYTAYNALNKADETTATSLKIVNRGDYQEVEYVLHADVYANNAFPAFILEFHAMNGSKPTTVILDDFAIYEVGSGSDTLLYSEDFEDFSDVKELDFKPLSNTTRTEMGRVGDTVVLPERAYSLRTNPSDSEVKVLESNEFGISGECYLSMRIFVQNVSEIVFGFTGCTEERIVVSALSGTVTGLDANAYRVSVSGNILTVTFKVHATSRSAKVSVSLKAEDPSRGALMQYASFKLSHIAPINTQVLISYSDTVETVTLGEEGGTVWEYLPTSGGVFGGDSYVLGLTLESEDITSLQVAGKTVDLTNGELNEAKIRYSFSEGKGTIRILAEAGEGPLVQITSDGAGTVVIKECFVLQDAAIPSEDSLHGAVAFSYDFEEDGKLTYGMSWKLYDGCIGGITYDKTHVIGGSSSFCGGYDYRNEGDAWDKLFDLNGFTVKSDTVYTVSFDYRVERDPRGGRFYFIFNHKTGTYADDVYYGFTSLGADTTYMQGVRNYSIIDHGDYQTAIVTLATGSEQYANALFGINGGGTVVIDNLEIRENALLPLSREEATYVEPERNEENDITVDFSDPSKYSLRSGQYFRGMLVKGAVNIVNTRDGEWAEGLTIERPLEKKVYTVSFLFTPEDDVAEGYEPVDNSERYVYPDLYVLFKSDSTPETSHFFALYDELGPKAFNEKEVSYQRGISDFVVRPVGDGRYQATFTVRPIAEGLKLVFGVFGEGAVTIDDVTIGEGLFTVALPDPILPPEPETPTPDDPTPSTPEPETPDPSDTTEEDPADNSADEGGTKKKGCSSAVGPGLASILVLVGAAAVLSVTVRRKRDGK